MTNTNRPATPLQNRRWVTAGRARNTSHNLVHELLRLDAPADQVTDLFDHMLSLPGSHKVELTRQRGDVMDGRYIESPWFSITFRGTDRAVQGAANVLMLSGLQNLDPNADHDHAACLARAAEMGVPAWSAHTPETYLSS